MRRMRWYHWFLILLYLPLLILVMMLLAIADMFDPEPDLDKLYPQRRKK